MKIYKKGPIRKANNRTETVYKQRKKSKKKKVKECLVKKAQSFLNKVKMC